MADISFFFIERFKAKGDMLELQKGSNGYFKKLVGVSVRVFCFLMPHLQ